jgi:hypothetical protein
LILPAPSKLAEAAFLKNYRFLKKQLTKAEVPS